MSENRRCNRSAYMNNLYRQTGDILENSFRIDVNTREKILEEYFSEGYLPKWYFYSNSPRTIAHHIYMLTHFLNANSDMLSQSGDADGSKTYFLNVGRDYPGRLAGILDQNRAMDIVGIDSETTAGGLRIVTLDKRGGGVPALGGEELEKAEALNALVRAYADERGIRRVGEFLSSLNAKYIREEISVQLSPERIFRHLSLFDKAAESEAPVCEAHRLQEELRISLAMSEPVEEFVETALAFFKRRRINLARSYYDLFESGSLRVGIYTVYLRDFDADPDKTASEIRDLYDAEKGKDPGVRSLAIESLIRNISASDSKEELTPHLQALRELCRENLKPGGEIGNFYLNCVTDFLEAASVLGLDRHDGAMKTLLGFEAFDEFYVSCPRDGRISNKPGYRIKHNSLRGPAKGGIRIDEIVNFSEVAALSFMMTWKCARSRILFGGGKGGLMLNPREYEAGSIDFFDTLSNFGRSLFMVTGPLKDVPAGDVGCGAQEIGRMFEGFKSALRDLALMVYGVRHNVTMIGDRVISLEEARTILEEAFGIDHTDTRILRELGANQDYLELVVASQITGKPRMGLAVRTGATGRGMCYATLAAVGGLYLDGKWLSSEELEDDEATLLKKAASVDGALILEGGGREALGPDEWDILVGRVYPKLLKGKKVVVQGSGKVGSSIMKEMEAFAVNLTAVADAGGAVLGDHLNPDELLAAIEASRGAEDRGMRASVVNGEENVREKIYGAAEGAAILELDCDILFTAALENAITEENAPRIAASLVVCGSNGSNSSKAEKILGERDICVLYDFLANGAGVTASYFEWLRNISQRRRFEAEQIYGTGYDDAVMDPYVMPEFADRVKAILRREESFETTREWNMIIRDIMFSAVNEDFKLASRKGISLKSAGFVNALIRVLAAALARMPDAEEEILIKEFPPETGQMIEAFRKHPEYRMMKEAAL